MTSNIEKFNTIVGLVFSQLYDKFPIPTGIDEGEIVKGLGFEVKYQDLDPSFYDNQKFIEWPEFQDGTSIYNVFYSALDWLEQEGFIRKAEHLNWVLTARALSALSAQPGVLTEPLGKRLTSAATGAATEAGRAAIGEVVGQVIAGVAKGLFNG